jgi:hypothetical protein
MLTDVPAPDGAGINNCWKHLDNGFGRLIIYKAPSGRHTGRKVSRSVLLKVPFDLMVVYMFCSHVAQYIYAWVHQ